MRRILLGSILLAACAVLGCALHDDPIPQPLVPPPPAESQAGASSDTYDESTLTRVGDTAPDIAWTTLAGDKQRMADLKGKVVLVNFWATWCPPCRAEMPLLEERVWGAFKEKDFVMVAISREESVETLRKFLKDKKISFPVAADLDRSIYGRYATKFIPRSYVIDRKGKIVFQSVGFDTAEFDEMVATTKKALQESN